MKTPMCRNPQHPLGRDKTMFFLEEREGAYVFACQACKDVNRKMSIQVFTKPALKRMVRDTLRSEGRLLRMPPPVRKPQMCRQRHKRIEWDGRRSTDGRYELILYRTLGNGDLQVQMAIDGNLCPMMDDHIASREEYPDDSSYFSRVAESSELMLHLYGDARNPLSEDEIRQRQQMTF
jgi:hypothetical protein